MSARSIHRLLLGWVLAAFALGAAVLIAISWWRLTHEMNEVFEDNLKQVALAVAQHHGTGGAAPLRLAQELPRVYEEYGRFEFATAVWSRGGELLARSDPPVKLPFRSRSGLSEVMVDGDRWYLYTVVLEERIVQAAQLASERATLARETSLQLVWPALGLVLLIGLMITLALRRGLAPLATAAGAVASRSARSLHPIALDSQAPELRPLVGAINELMARLDQTLTNQRAFLADAAHELRTPITALRLQAQLVERSGAAGDHSASVAELRAGIERAQHVVERLLQLARVDDAPVGSFQPVDLAALVRDAVVRFSTRAEAHGVDLGATSRAAPVVNADAQQLAMALDNLIDNALRHTPPGGRVDVAADRHDALACLVVTDTGSGIAAEERERVFDRFYRGTRAQGHGTGLGLSIVRAVAERHGAQVRLDDAPGQGLRVRVCFAADAQAMPPT